MSGSLNALIANPQPPQINLGAAAQGANQILQLRQQQQKMQDANALRDILGQPDAIDPETQTLKPEALQKVMAINPQVGQTLQQNALQMQQHKLQMDAMKTKSAYDAANYVGDNMASVYEQYQEAIKDGKTTADKALSDGREAWTKTREDMRTGGVIGPDIIKHLPPAFDPKDFQTRIQNNESYRKWWKDQRDQERLTNQEREQKLRDERVGTATGVDIDNKPIIIRPNVAPGQPKAVYLDDTPVPDEKLTGAHKMGTGGAGDASKGWEELTDTDGTTYQHHKGTGENKTMTGEPYTPKGSATKLAGPRSQSAAGQDRAAIETVAKTDYEKELGRPVNPNDPNEKAELNRRILKAEDDRVAGRAGSAAGARIAATGGNDRLAQQNIVRTNLEAELGRPLTQADNAEVDRRLLAAETARKAGQAGAVAGAKQEAAAKPVPVLVNGVAMDAIWKDGKYFNIDGTPMQGNVVGSTRQSDKKTPGQAVESDAMAIADKRIADQEAKDGRPLDQAQRAEIRQAARQDPKIQEAARKLDATAIDDDAAKLIAEESLRGDWHGTVGMGRNQASMRKVADWRARLAKDQGLSGAALAANTAEFNGIMAAERVLGTRGAGIDLGIAEAQKFAPMVLRASDMVDRTKYPTVNSMVLAVEKGTGGESVIRLIDAMNAYKMAYTQILTRGGMPTDDARRRSDEVINAAWSNGQIKTAIDQLNQEMNGARSAVPEVRDNLYKTLTGNTRASPVDQVPSPVSGGAQGGSRTPPQPAIDTLKSRVGAAPDAAAKAAEVAKFEKHFGPGSAQQYLGGPAAQQPAAPAATPTAAQPAQAAAPRVDAKASVPKQGDAYKPSTQEQFDALQPGDIYINPADGKKYKKK